MQRKPPRRTRERIVEAAMRLFNEFGEPNVTTTTVADELNISPGNLYYHFGNKDEIVNEIFAAFEREIRETLAAPTRRTPTVEDTWLFLHLIFELVWKYRFLYRDLNDLLSRNRHVETHMKEIVAHTVRTAAQLCRGMVAAGEMKATPGEIDALAANMVIVATYWLSYEFVREPRRTPDGAALARGAYHAMAMLAPFLTGNSRRLFEKLAVQYLEH
jgi:AcrR family transcriptional regulator